MSSSQIILLNLLVVAMMPHCCLAFLFHASCTCSSSFLFNTRPSETSIRLQPMYNDIATSSTGDEGENVYGISNITAILPITTTTIANQTFLLPSKKDFETIQERQVCHKLEPSQVTCVSKACRHGFPQAFGFHPTNGPKLVSGLFRLSCPLLVQQIDEWEGQGGVREMTDWLRNDASGDKRRGYERANQMQKRIRKELVADDYEKLVTRMGKYNADKFLESGVAGIPSSQTYNVKCIHAHVADHLCRSSESDITNTSTEGNIIGEYALNILQRRGVPILGNDVCWQQCSLNHEREPSDWNYVPKKNRQGLRSTRQRRKELREED
jgi:hypothetical protein